MAHEFKFGRRPFLAMTGMALGGAAVSAALAGCGDAEPKATASSGPGPTLITAAGGENGSAGVMRQALKLAGDELGTAKVELANMAQGTALLSVRNGSATCAMMSWVNLAQARDNGVEMVAIAPAWASHASIVVHAKSPVETLDQLKGLRVGSSSRTSGVYSETRAALASKGIDIEKDLKLKPIDDSALLRALFLKGDFDAIITSEPAISQLLVDGSTKELLQVGTFEAERHQGRSVPVNSWGVRKDWLDKLDAEAMRKLFQRASQMARSSREPYDLAAKVGGLSPQANDLFFQRFSKLVVTEFSEQGFKDAQTQLDEALAAGLIKKPYKIADLALGA